MPLITCYPSASFIKELHTYLIEVYREEKQPKHIELGYMYESLIDGVALRIRGEQHVKFNNFLERAANLFFNLNRGHPFVDGNKRTSLLVTFYFLMWNGYFLTIPKDADIFIKQIADASRTDLTVDHCYNWLVKNSTVNINSIKVHLEFLFLRGIFKFFSLLTGKRGIWEDAFIHFSDKLLDRLLKNTNTAY